MKRGLCSLALVLAACAPTDPSGDDVELGRRAQPLLGVPQDGYPSYHERLMLVAMNRVRTDPNNETLATKHSCSVDYPPQKPLLPSHDGSRAARFHCNNLLKTHSGLSHKSYCTLRSDIGTANCDGSADCACVTGTEAFNCTTLGGQGTSPGTRASYFNFPYAGEIGAAGYGDGWSAVRGWVFECAGQDGHRRAVASASYTLAGLGWSSGSGGCWGNFGFVDFAGSSTPVPVLPAGVHRPETGGATTSFDFYVNYYDPGGAPQSVNVVIDGHCHPMTKEIGVSPTNATYKVSVAPGSGCHQYWFLAKDSAGARQIWPEVGSWGVGSCSAYNATSLPADCEGCVAGQACSSADGCSTGTTACSPSQSCANLTPVADGTSCGTGKVCRSGSCETCPQGAPCTSADGCRSGIVSCSTGLPECSGFSPRPDGTACPGGTCTGGVCRSEDGGTVPVDAGFDAGTLPEVDAGPPPGADGGGAELDGGWSELEGEVVGGCGCREAGGASWLAVLLALLWARGRLKGRAAPR